MKFFDFSFTFAIAFLLADIGIIYWVYTGEFNLYLFVIPVFLLIFALIYLAEYNKKYRDK
ncbi:hypothetical protein [Mammaliicoccus sciuri]|uniref:hypothetical protein n=1 Tax=Mammaliicoccus sciuri TaxID=1296 RepID=UPI002887B5B3|nr:hypothetical protein [Mammaliicoccus sciuri]MDT0697005.1 hypothetical protein [Mammaliicoccus sciuri]